MLEHFCSALWFACAVTYQGLCCTAFLPSRATQHNCYKLQDSRTSDRPTSTTSSNRGNIRRANVSSDGARDDVFSTNAPETRGHSQTYIKAFSQNCNSLSFRFVANPLLRTNLAPSSHFRILLHPRSSDPYSHSFKAPEQRYSDVYPRHHINIPPSLHPLLPLPPSPRRNYPRHNHHPSRRSTLQEQERGEGSYGSG